jgi:ADP-heptose:LPS heptosyltransferase
VRSHCPGLLPPPVKLPLRRLAALLQRVDVMVSNDCGPMHLAPAVGTPAVGIFGPGQPEIWFPYREDSGHRAVQASIECIQCGRDYCSKMDCMRAVTVEEVFRAASRGMAIGFQHRKENHYKPPG